MNSLTLYVGGILSSDRNWRDWSDLDNFAMKSSLNFILDGCRHCCGNKAEVPVTNSNGVILSSDGAIRCPNKITGSASSQLRSDY
jgi:hypothetical protein